jgi:hypothetical protein
MAVQTYTDLFNKALNDLSAFLKTVTGLRVVTDPRNLVPNCVLIQAPSFTAFNYNIVDLTFPVTLVGVGPGNEDALRTLLNQCSLVLAKNVAVTDGRPVTLDMGGTMAPAYELTVKMQAQTA